MTWIGRSPHLIEVLRVFSACVWVVFRKWCTLLQNSNSQNRSKEKRNKPKEKKKKSRESSQKKTMNPPTPVSRTRGPPSLPARSSSNPPPTIPSRCPSLPPLPTSSNRNPSPPPLPARSPSPSSPPIVPSRNRSPPQSPHPSPLLPFRTPSSSFPSPSSPSSPFISPHRHNGNGNGNQSPSLPPRSPPHGHSPTTPSQLSTFSSFSVSSPSLSSSVSSHSPALAPSSMVFIPISQAPSTPPSSLSSPRGNCGGQALDISENNSPSSTNNFAVRQRRQAAPSTYITSRSDLQQLLAQLEEEEKAAAEGGGRRGGKRGGMVLEKGVTPLTPPRQPLPPLPPQLQRRPNRTAEQMQKRSKRLSILPPKTNWDFVEQISDKGHFSVVNLVKHRQTGTVSAVKILDVDDILEVMGDPTSPKQIIARMDLEVKMLSMMNHPNVLRLVGVEKPTERRTLIYTEYVSNGSLFSFMGEEGIPEKQAINYFVQLLLGMEYIHSLKIIHCDLKLENLLIDEHHQLKIIDFGLSFFDGDQDKYFDGFTPYYVPPEMADISVKPTYSGDVWSAGIIFYAILTGVFPFPEAGPDPKKFSIYFPDKIKKDTKKLLLMMLNLYPNNRPSFSELAKNRFLARKIAAFKQEHKYS